MTNGMSSKSYPFDSVGNRTTSHLSATYGYQPFSKQTSTASSNYAYNANGNMITKTDVTGTTQYIWDAENRLKQVIKPDTTSVSYKYDALGRRSERTLSSGAWTRFTYDGREVIKDTNSDATTVSYLNGLGIDNKLKLTSGGVSKYFLQDHLGSTTGLADATGTITNSIAYDSFGNSTGNLNTRYQFTGREFDNFTGLQFSRARWYDPNLGRFISEDPMGFMGGTNLYAYVGNHPIKFADPLGLFPAWGPWKYHQRIGSRALNGLATPAQIDAINRANGDFDEATQDPIYAPSHAMRRPGQSVEEARAEANDFVRNKICLARRYASQGLDDDAMKALGQAIHTLQDSASPSHFGFKEAWPDTWPWTIWNFRHYAKENFDPGAGSVADFQTIRGYGYFTGEIPMPRDFFVDNYVDFRDDWNHIGPLKVR